MKPITRYVILLFAGITDLIIGMYAFGLVITQIVTGLEFLWVIFLGMLTTVTGAFLIYRTLPALLSIQRGESAPVPVDERTRQILHQAAFNAFTFLIIALIVMVSLTMGLPQWGYILTWNELTTALLVVWTTSILVFSSSMAYYYWK